MITMDEKISDERKKKYTTVKPGLYFQSGIYDFKPIYILSGKYTEMHKQKWHGVLYKYWDFAEKNIYTFNEYWDDFIDTLIPITDKDSIDAAKLVIQKHIDSSKRNADSRIKEMNDLEIIFLESK